MRVADVTVLSVFLLERLRLVPHTLVNLCIVHRADKCMNGMEVIVYSYISNPLLISTRYVVSLPLCPSICVYVCLCV